MRVTTISSLLIAPLLFCFEVVAQVSDNCRKDESTGEVLCVDPAPSCQDNIQYYLQLADDESNILTRALRSLIKEVAADGRECSVRLQEIESEMNTFWASDPYCRLERKDLKRLIETEDVDSKIPRFAMRTITDALDQQPSSCRVGLSAAQSVLVLYLPDLMSTVYPISAGRPADDLAQRELNRADKAKKKTSKPKRGGRSKRCRQ